MRQLTPCMKEEYPTKKEARKALRNNFSGNLAGGRAIEAYRCKRCNLWHLGKTKGK